MKQNTKENIVCAFLLILTFLTLISIISYAIIDTKETCERREFIETSFKESDYNISEDYTITWTVSRFTDDYSQFLDTDWYYWETKIFNKYRPFENGWITLWVNIETFETYYVGELP